MVTKLFSPLPVRRKEWERNAKREFGRVLALLNAYALVPCTQENRGVRLLVTNQPDKGCVLTPMRSKDLPLRSLLSVWPGKAAGDTLSDGRNELDPRICLCAVGSEATRISRPAGSPHQCCAG